MELDQRITPENSDPAEEATPETFEQEQDRPMRAASPVLTDQEVLTEPENNSANEPELPLPVIMPKEMTMEDIFYGVKRFEKFRDRSDQANRNIRNLVNQISLAATLMEKVEKARNLLVEGKQNYEEADRLLSEVEYRIEYIQRVKQASRKVGPILFAYELVLFFLLAAGFYALNIHESLAVFREAIIFNTVDFVQFLNSLIWGSLGGIVGALFALWKHIASDQDFDPQYSLWYITTPILGIGLGAFVFLVVQAGFFSLTAGGEGGEIIRSALIIYVLAWICGFKQNVVYEIVRRILDVFRVNTEDQKKTPAAPVEAQPES